MNLRKLFFVFLVLVFSGCATYAGLNYDELFGAPEVRERQVALDSPQAQYFMQEVKPEKTNTKKTKKSFRKFI